MCTVIEVSKILREHRRGTNSCLQKVEKPSKKNDIWVGYWMKNRSLSGGEQGEGLSEQKKTLYRRLDISIM